MVQSEILNYLVHSWCLQQYLVKVKFLVIFKYLWKLIMKWRLGDLAYKSYLSKKKKIKGDNGPESHQIEKFNFVL